jgi:aminoglycoside phosphotransferase (APT) family kinase protein
LSASSEKLTALDNFLRAQGLAEPGEIPRWTELTGGVSSEIWRVDLPGRSLCVKRALPRLKVSADWQAPVSRNQYEWKWLCFASEQVPQAVPVPLANDTEMGVLAMSFLPPEQYPMWKGQLLSGIVRPEVAGRVGKILGQLHSSSATKPELAQVFDSLENFHALRLEPYLLATALRHPDLSEQLRSLVERTGSMRMALVHGDVSPKNILIGPNGPVLLDAECAWYGDPAFDLAFCLSHLSLKTWVLPEFKTGLMTSFSWLAEAYFTEARWESRTALETRAAALLPALMLARVDGKSPVEYLSDEQRAAVRVTARRLLKSSVMSLSRIAAEIGKWHEAVGP